MEVLEKLRKDLDNYKHLPKIYVVGATNSGKSSFINALIFKANKYKESHKIHYKSKYNILTESAMPGTTLELITIDDLNLGFKVIDTPGIPNFE